MSMAKRFVNLCTRTDHHYMRTRFYLQVLKHSRSNRNNNKNWDLIFLSHSNRAVSYFVVLLEMIKNYDLGLRDRSDCSPSSLYAYRHGCLELIYYAWKLHDIDFAIKLDVWRKHRETERFQNHSHSNGLSRCLPKNVRFILIKDLQRYANFMVKPFRIAIRGSRELCSSKAFSHKFIQRVCACGSLLYLPAFTICNATMYNKPISKQTWELHAYDVTIWPNEFCWIVSRGNAI